MLSGVSLSYYCTQCGDGYARFVLLCRACEIWALSLFGLGGGFITDALYFNFSDVCVNNGIKVLQNHRQLREVDPANSFSLNLMCQSKHSLTCGLLPVQRCVTALSAPVTAPGEQTVCKPFATLSLLWFYSYVFLKWGSVACSGDISELISVQTNAQNPVITWLLMFKQACTRQSRQAVVLLRDTTL